MSDQDHFLFFVFFVAEQRVEVEFYLFDVLPWAAIWERQNHYPCFVIFVSDGYLLHSIVICFALRDINNLGFKNSSSALVVVLDDFCRDAVSSVVTVRENEVAPIVWLIWVIQLEIKSLQKFFESIVWMGFFESSENLLFVSMMALRKCED